MRSYNNYSAVTYVRQYVILLNEKALCLYAIVLEFPSAGSTFKRPEGYFAGKLIQDAGLKGYTVGGAQVSEKHSGFVVNRGGATAEEVAFLIKQVQKKVMKQFNVMMQPEVRFIGFTDTEVRE